MIQISLRLRCLSAQERAVETIEYIGIGAAVVALLGATVAVVDNWGGYHIGAEVVRTTQCWISSLNDAIDCPPAEEIAHAPAELALRPGGGGVLRRLR